MSSSSASVEVLGRWQASRASTEKLSVVPAVSNAIMGAPALEFSTPAPRKSETAILESSLSSIRFAKMQVFLEFDVFGPPALVHTQQHKTRRATRSASQHA